MTLSRPSPHRLVRRRLQPGAVAGAGLDRGRRADALGRRHAGDRRGVLLGPARAAPGRVRPGLAGAGDRAAARGRHRGRPRHRDRVAAALAGPAGPGVAAGARRRHPAVARQPAGLLPVLGHLPRAVAGAGGPDRRTVRPASRRGALARRQRVGQPRGGVLLRPQRGAVPGLAGPPARRARRAQRRLGNEFLVAALLGLGRGAAPAGDTDLPQPGPAARLAPVLLGRAARPVPGRAGGAAAPLRPAGHDELRRLPAGGGLLVLGAAPGRGRPGHLPGPGGSADPRRRGDGRRPHARARRRPAVAADGADHRPGQLARPQRRQATGAVPALVTAGGRPRLGRGAALPVAAVGGRRGEVALGDGRPRRRRTAGGVGARPGAGDLGRGGRHPGGGRGGDPVLLAVLVGAITNRRSRRPSSTTWPRPAAGTAPPGTRASPST